MLASFLNKAPIVEKRHMTSKRVYCPNRLNSHRVTSITRESFKRVPRTRYLKWEASRVLSKKNLPSSSDKRRSPIHERKDFRGASQGYIFDYSHMKMVNDSIRRGLDVDDDDDEEDDDNTRHRLNLSSSEFDLESKADKEDKEDEEEEEEEEHNRNWEVCSFLREKSKNVVKCDKVGDDDGNFGDDDNEKVESDDTVGNGEGLDDKSDYDNKTHGPPCILNHLANTAALLKIAEDSHVDLKQYHDHHYHHHHHHHHHRHHHHHHHYHHHHHHEYDTQLVAIDLYRDGNFHESTKEDAAVALDATTQYFNTQPLLAYTAFSDME